MPNVPTSLLVLELVSLACIVHLLLRRGPLWKRAMWSVIVVVPILGPLLYGALYQPSPVPGVDTTPTDVVPGM